MPAPLHAPAHLQAPGVTGKLQKRKLPSVIDLDIFIGLFYFVILSYEGLMHVNFTSYYTGCLLNIVFFP